MGIPFPFGGLLLVLPFCRDGKHVNKYSTWTKKQKSKKEKEKARLSAAGTFVPATIGTGTVDGDGLIGHELQNTSPFARNVVVLLESPGNAYPVPNKPSFMQWNPNKCGK